MKKYYFSILLILYILTILVFTLMPGWSTNRRLGYGIFEFRADYWYHLFAYIGFGFLFIAWQMNALIDKSIRNLIPVFLLCISFAFSTEVLQLFVPGRSFNIKDFICNSIGIGFAFFMFVLFRPLVKRTKLKLFFLSSKN